MEAPAREPLRSAPAHRPEGRKLVLPGALAILAAACLAGSWRIWGGAGLAASGLGIAIGASISSVAHVLRGRAWKTSGPKLVSAVMTSLLTSFGLFVAASILVGLTWKEGAPAALLTGLAIYLTASFYEAFAGRPGGTERK